MQNKPLDSLLKSKEFLDYIASELQLGDLEKVINIQNALNLSKDEIGTVLTNILQKPSKSIVKIVEKTEDKPAEKPTQPRYYFIRRQVGGEILEEGTRRTVFKINERDYRTNPIANGQYFSDQYGKNLLPDIKPIQDDIIEFTGSPRRDLTSNALRIDVDLNNNPLSDVNPAMNTYFIKHSYATVAGIDEGDIVTLAFSKSKPQHVSIRWFNKAEDLPEKVEKITPKKIKPATEAPTVRRQLLDMDLTGKSVAIVIGDSIRSTVFEDRLVPYGTSKTQVFDGFTDEPTLKRQISKFKPDVIVSNMDYNRHHNSHAVVDYAKDNNIPYAAFEGKGIAQVEQAIYRAINGLPYQTAEYKFKESD